VGEGLLAFFEARQRLIKAALLVMHVRHRAVHQRHMEVLRPADGEEDVKRAEVARERVREEARDGSEEVPGFEAEERCRERRARPARELRYGPVDVRERGVGVERVLPSDLQKERRVLADDMSGSKARRAIGVTALPLRSEKGTPEMTFT